MVPYYVIVNYYIPLLLLLLNYSSFYYVVAQQKLNVLYQWKQVDFTFSNVQAREAALRTNKFIPENCIILDVDAWYHSDATDRLLINSGHISNNYNSAIKPTSKKRIFVTLPRFKSGVPVTLATISNQRRGNTPLLAPFPNWEAQREGNCDGITSVYRIKIDKCGILWVLDTGRIENFSPNPKNLCPPKVLAYDLNNGDTLIRKLTIPNQVLEPDSLLVTIAVDIRDSFCQDTFLYLADVTGFKLIVYDVKKNRVWRVGSNYFYPFPLDSKFSIAGSTFNLMDGLLALTLGPLQNGDRQLYFHSLASVREGSVSTSVIRNYTLFVDDADSSWDLFSVSEPARSSQSASEDMSDSGIMFFGLLSEIAIACWNSQHPFTPDHIHIVEQNNETLQFPSGIKVIGDTLWVLTTEFQNFIAGTTEPNDVKYRILVGSVSNLIYETGCDISEYPRFPNEDKFFYSWKTSYPEFSNNILLPNLSWEPVRTRRKKKMFQKQRSPTDSKLVVSKPPYRPPLKPPPSSTWWSYDCRFQDYGPYAGLHVMCYFLGPSFVHYHNKDVTSLL